MLVLYEIFIFTDAVKRVTEPEIIDIENEVPVPSLQKGWWFFYDTELGNELNMYHKKLYIKHIRAISPNATFLHWVFLASFTIVWRKF